MHEVMIDLPELSSGALAYAAALLVLSAAEAGEDPTMFAPVLAALGWPATAARHVAWARAHTDPTLTDEQAKAHRALAINASESAAATEATGWTFEVLRRLRMTRAH